MTTTDLWPTALDSLMALSKHYGPVMDKIAKAAGVERGIRGLLIATLSFETESVSNKKLQVRVPYEDFVKRLEEAVQSGLMTASGKDEYMLTEKGVEIGQKVILSAYARMENLDPMRSPELNCLALLLNRLVKACLSANEPPGKWSINYSRVFDPGENAPLLIRVDQYLSDLSAYRDDAHLAAWRPIGITGPAWESLTLIWNKEVNTLESLHKRLSHRRHTRPVYAEVINNLEARRLIVSKDRKLQITTEGNKLRQDVEDVTNQYFYTPWECLNEEDIQTLQNLLICLTKGLSETSC